MNTFHDFASCIYTTQGQFLCKKNERGNGIEDESIRRPPMIVENFAQVNTTPNQNSSVCTTLGKKLSDAVSGYNCTTFINNAPPNCEFQFKCKE